MFCIKCKLKLLRNFTVICKSGCQDFLRKKIELLKFVAESGNESEISGQVLCQRYYLVGHICVVQIVYRLEL